MKKLRRTWEQMHGKVKAAKMKADWSKRVKDKGTYEQQYGKKKADEIKAKLSKSFEQKFGKKIAKEIKYKISKTVKEGLKNRTEKQVQEFNAKRNKGVENMAEEKKKKWRNNISKALKERGSYEQQFGKEKSLEMRANLSKKKKETLENMTEEELNEWKDRWSKSHISIDRNLIINTTKERIKKYGSFCKSEWDKFMGDICSQTVIRKRFGNPDKFAEECGFEWKRFERDIVPNIGNNETSILDDIEQEENIKLDRQFKIGSYYIDGYNKETNTAYEVDEPAHFKGTNPILDKIREDKIRNKIGCKFIRINEQKFLKSSN